MNQCILFEDIFDIKALNENGKKFERGWQYLRNYPLINITDLLSFINSK